MDYTENVDDYRTCHRFDYEHAMFGTTSPPRSRTAPTGSAWTPTLTNLTLGNGAVVARYQLAGDTCNFRFRFTLGSTSAVGLRAKVQRARGTIGNLCGQCRPDRVDGGD